MPETQEAKPTRRSLTADEPVVTRHKLSVGGKQVGYTATAGFLPLVTEYGEHEANVFFVAYTLDGGTKKRPLMFSFNGGPGSSSVWLHLGALGPKRVQMLEDGSMPPPPYKLAANRHTWLTETDLVFIDPVGTGYSRAADKETGKKFWNLDGDIQSVGQVIRLYLTRYERWTSPLFLVGESYGTTRAAGLAGHLIEKGIAFNGIVLVSSVLNFQTASFTKGNDLPYVLFLPTYCATAWYHKALSKDLQRDLQKTLRECEAFAGGRYVALLAKGDRLTASERKELVEQVSRFTGLSEEFVSGTDARVNIQQFCKELLRHERRTVGRLDSRFKGMDARAVGSEPEYDPSMSAIRPPYTSALNDYVRRELRFKTDLEYHILGGGFEEPWDWKTGKEGHPDTSEALRIAFAKNPHMRLMVASGYYDLATPYFATDYTLAHLDLDASLRSHIQTRYYEAGHMMYIHEKCLAELKKDMKSFVEWAS
ncbi:peptidase S10 [Fimbriimonadia bacterium ATM]|nr:MAG: peptidase S10 [Armatimonadota bacterium]MBC6968757.1 peptidase S10 [Armatimonadota bacterium]MCE7899886.1 peptidase S10 [Armatimonadetes bacterium ATM1]MDL1928661.1 peptidase S10 [Fimbriimonadia bacterium ATM]RIJ96940.1 MAG: peptidase S10 [Armatimonadota bacterium]